jgi:hypothetical protein
VKQLYWLLLVPILLAGACTSPALEKTVEVSAAQATVVVRLAPLPASTVVGYHFPEDSTTIEGWMQRHNSMAIYRHGWGLWAALMTPVVPTRGYTMRVYQTRKPSRSWPLTLASKKANAKKPSQ